MAVLTRFRFRYVTVGGGAAVAWGAVGVEGVKVTLIIEAWSRERGHKEIKQILSEVHRILHDADLMVTGHDLVWLRFEFAEFLLDADGATYHGIARYKALTNQQ